MTTRRSAYLHPSDPEYRAIQARARMIDAALVDAATEDNTTAASPGAPTEADLIADALDRMDGRTPEREPTSHRAAPAPAQRSAPTEADLIADELDRMDGKVPGGATAR